MLKRAVVAMTLVMVALVVPAAPSLAVADTVTYVSLSGTERDYITQGESHFYGLGAGQVSVSGSVASSIRVLADENYPYDYFFLDFAAAPGETLVAGQYDDAERASFRHAGHPGLDISGTGRGCNEVGGSFTVKEIAPDLSRLWIVFEQHCEGSRFRSASFGEIKINMPADPSGVQVAPSAISWPAIPARSSDEVVVRATNAGAAPVSVESVAVSGDTEAFAVADSGCADLAPGSWCDLAVEFSPDLVGDYAADLTVTDSGGGTSVVPVSGTAVADPVSAVLTVDKERYAYGATAHVTATVTGSYVDPQLSIFKQVSGGPRELVASGAADDDGSFRTDLAVKKTTGLTLEWTDGDQSGTAAAYARVRPITVRVKTDARMFHYGDRVRLEIHLEGAAPHRDVEVYESHGDSAPVLVAQPEVDASGLSVVFVRARTSSTFTARWVDDGEIVAEHSNQIAVRAGVRLVGRGYVSVADKFHIYRPGTRIVTRGKVMPNKAGECVRFEVEYLRGWWRRLGRTDCVTLSDSSRAGAYLPYDKRFKGLKLRFGMEYDGDEVNRGDWSNWFYARYGR